MTTSEEQIETLGLSQVVARLRVRERKRERERERERVCVKQFSVELELN